VPDCVPHEPPEPQCLDLTLFADKTDANANAEDWAPDGKSLYYRYGDKVYIVEVRTDGSKPVFSAPKELITIPQGIDLISILPDQKRFSRSGRLGSAVHPRRIWSSTGSS